MADAKPSAQHRLDYVDSIRGLAALSVVYLHASLAFHASATPLEQKIFYVLGMILDPGKFGVVVFFMVSGFVVPFSLRGKKGSGLARFALSRFFRLYPLYWLSIAASLALGVLLHEVPPDWSTILINVTMLQQFVGAPNIIGVYWTLQIELIFYAAAALLFLYGVLGKPRALERAAALALTSAAGLGILRFVTRQPLPVAVPLALCLMFTGTLWRRFIVEGEADAGRRAKRMLVLFLAAMPAVSLVAYNFDAGHNEIWYRYTLTYYAAIAAFILLTRYVRVQAPVFVWLGRISYAVYLFHPLVLGWYETTVYDAHGPLPAHCHIAAVMFPTILLSHLLFRHFEAPMVALGHAVGAALRGPTPQPAGPARLQPLVE